MIVADTDVLIDFLANRGPAARVVADAFERGRLATTAVSRFELFAGARGGRQERTVRQLLDALPTLALDRDAADRAADLSRSLARGGGAIGMADCLIAGIVLVQRGELLTRNREHFGRVAGLRLVPLEGR